MTRIRPLDIAVGAIIENYSNLKVEFIFCLSQHLIDITVKVDVLDILVVEHIIERNYRTVAHEHDCLYQNEVFEYFAYKIWIIFEISYSGS
jgi:hypothetical protein